MTYQSTAQQTQIGAMHSRLESASSRLMLRKHDQLSRLARSVQLLDPKQVLKRGYSISRYGGRAVRKASDLKKGTILITEFYAGETKSRIEEIETGEDE